MALKSILLSFITMIAFAANSVLCRLALKGTSITPHEFTTIRLIAGALILLPILFTQKGHVKFNLADVFPKALALFSYALFFSFGYTQIDAGPGALILFVSVQITMVGVSLYKGSKLSQVEWAGFFLATCGLIYFLLPGLTSPPLKSSIFMLMAGSSWGIYSLLGKGTLTPIISTAKNFLIASLLAALSFILLNDGLPYYHQGTYLAIISGAITSGLGYVLWYITLRNIKTTTASIIQLSVPIITAFGGVFFISEKLSLRLSLSTLLIFTGIFLTIKGNYVFKQRD